MFVSSETEQEILKKERETSLAVQWLWLGLQGFIGEPQATRYGQKKKKLYIYIYKSLKIMADKTRC